MNVFLTHNIVAIGQVDAKNCITLKKDLQLKGIKSISFDIEHDCCELDIQNAYLIYL